MKLAELGLKAKPETKYFAHGYVKFSTVNGELFYQISFYKTAMIPKATTETRPVKDKEHFKQIMSITARSVEQ